MCLRKVRLWFKDGTYMDVHNIDAHYYESDPEWDHSENLGEVREGEEDDECST